VLCTAVVITSQMVLEGELTHNFGICRIRHQTQNTITICNTSTQAMPWRIAMDSDTQAHIAPYSPIWPHIAPHSPI
jgi:hypothetical protein